MYTYSITVAYNGAPFSGFAKQPGQLTVQGELEQALELLFRRGVPTTCAGRTDSGVHARGQIVSFDVDDAELRGRAERSLLRSLNALTHDDIAVIDLRRRASGFSARDFCWHVGKPLDVGAMREAAAHLIGEHDFKSFCMAASAEGKRTFRRVDEVNISVESPNGEDLLVVEVVGNAFLHSMVRAIVGTLVAVGVGNREPSWVADVLAARDRKAAGENAPARGLVLWEVEYPEGLA